MKVIRLFSMYRNEIINIEDPDPSGIIILKGHKNESIPGLLQNVDYIRFVYGGAGYLTGPGHSS